jgi:hypothetical protein
MFHSFFRRVNLGSRADSRPGRDVAVVISAEFFRICHEFYKGKAHLVLGHLRYRKPGSDALICVTVLTRPTPLKFLFYARTSVPAPKVTIAYFPFMIPAFERCSLGFITSSLHPVSVISESRHSIAFFPLIDLDRSI